MDDEKQGTSLLPPLEHPFWAADDVAENVIATVVDLENKLGEAERIVTEQEARCVVDVPLLKLLSDVCAFSALKKHLCPPPASNPGDVEAASCVSTAQEEKAALAHTVEWLQAKNARLVEVCPPVLSTARGSG